MMHFNAELASFFSFYVAAYLMPERKWIRYYDTKIEIEESERSKFAKNQSYQTHDACH